MKISHEKKTGFVLDTIALTLKTIPMGTDGTFHVKSDTNIEIPVVIMTVETFQN